MAQLFFKYGAMNSGKSIEILKVAHNYEEQNKSVLLFADKIEEIKTICWYCHKKASMNMRVVDGKPVYTGEQIQIGGNESYYPVCRYHYSHPGEERA